MKILTGIDVPFIPFGGSLICCDNWYSDLPGDVEVRFLALRPPSDERWWSIKDVKLLDIVKIKTPEAFPQYVTDLRKLVEEEIADFKPDILHCQHLNYGLSRAFVDIQTDVPKLGICHGTDVQAATAYPFLHDNLIHICDGLDELVFPNQTMADDFFDVYPRQKKYVINPLGIPDRYYPETLTPPSFDGKRRLEVLYAGRLLAWKGADIAVEAMSHITEDMHLTVIGNEDEAGYVASMQTFIREHHLEDKVTFIPQLPRDDLLKAFSQYDVMVLPSRKLEAFSLTVIEAQAMGLPIIYGSGGGIVDTAGNGGIMLEKNTPEELAKVLTELYHSPALLSKLQHKGFTNAQSYKLSGSKDRLFELSKELIAQCADQTLR
ncbi:MAG TPA: glycosyltransferase family 4 protein [Verrucomicrobiae bacterium]|nr:glycosyltransferase family 4 protein [Verrucomicrobiae bacterium]